MKKMSNIKCFLCLGHFKILNGLHAFVDSLGMKKNACSRQQEIKENQNSSHLGLMGHSLDKWGDDKNKSELLTPLD